MTTVAENEVLHEALTKITLGSLRRFKGLGVVPLLRFDATDPDWLYQGGRSRWRRPQAPAR